MRLTETEKCRASDRNSEESAAFCMLLRKHLSGAKLRDILQDGFERILTFVFDATNASKMSARIAFVFTVVYHSPNSSFGCCSLYRAESGGR